MILVGPISPAVQASHPILSALEYLSEKELNPTSIIVSYCNDTRNIIFDCTFCPFNCSIHHNRKGIAHPRTKDYVTIAHSLRCLSSCGNDI